MGFTPGIASPAPIHHQGTEDLGMVRAIPHATVIDPMDVTDMKQALDVACDTPGLVYMRGHRGFTPRMLDPDSFKFELGKTYPLREGSGVGVIATTALRHVGTPAAALAAQFLHGGLDQIDGRYRLRQVACDTGGDTVLSTVAKSLVEESETSPRRACSGGTLSSSLLEESCNVFMPLVFVEFELTLTRRRGRQR